MKPFLSIVLVLLGTLAWADPRAVALLKKAADFHGLSSPATLTSYEMETVYSSTSGGFLVPSRWLSRVDFRRQRDLGVRFVYARDERGIFFQRRIERGAGTFLYGFSSATPYDLGEYLAGNEVAAVSNVSLLAVRDQLQDPTYDGTITFGTRVLDQVSFTYHGGRGTAYFDQEGRYAGSLELDLKDELSIYHLVTAYSTVGGVLVPTRYTLYDDDHQFSGYGKVLNFRVNPALSEGDFTMHPSPPDPRGSQNRWGLELAPAEAAEFQGVLVAQPPVGPAAQASLAAGDHIIAVDGKNVTQASFYDAEGLFWGDRPLVLTVRKPDGKAVEVTLTP